MRFDLRKPCRECPFRPGGIALNGPRAQEIADAVTKDNLTFTCHKTISGDYEDDPEAEEESYHPGAGDQMCAGAMALVRKLGVPNQMIQIAERLRLLDPARLRADAECFDSVEQMVEAHENARTSATTASAT